MRVLLVAEGKHELGTAYGDGALATLCRRLGLEGSATFTPEEVKSRKVRANFQPGRNGGFKKRALAWIEYAREEQFDAIVLVIDEDGDQDRMIQLNEAQLDKRRSLPRALGIAIRTFDAWMLADDAALAKVLGVHVDRPPDPETIQNPKARCEELCDQGTRNLSLTKLYAAVADSLDLEVLSKRCPAGFAPFAMRVRALAGPINPLGG
jgi:hypothetical protein